MLKVNLCVGLGKVKQSKSVVFFNLFKVVSSLVVKVELSSITFVGSVVICVNSRTLFTCLIDFECLAQTAKTSIEIFSVNKAQS